MSSIARVAKRCFVALSTVASFAVSSASAADYYVSGLGDDANGGSAVAPFRTITKAVSQAGAGDTIYLDEGFYDTSADESFPIAINADLTIVGWSPTNGDIDRSARVVSGDNSTANLFNVSSGVSFSISDCVLRDSTDALVEMNTANIAATNVLFTQSTARSGTGDYNSAQKFSVGSVRCQYMSTMIFQGCDFIGMNRDVQLLDWNTPNTDTFTLKLYDCLVADNTVKFGNFVEGKGCKVVVDCARTTFRNNSQTNTGTQHDAYGGAVLWTRGNSNAKSKTNFTFDRCWFLGNSGRSLFGVNNVNSFRITNSLVAQNAVTGYHFGGHANTPDIRNCTIIGTAGGIGGLAGRNAVTTIRNSILANIDQLQVSIGWAGNADNLKIYDSIVYNCTPGLGVNAVSKYITDDPILENISVPYTDPAFDAHPRSYSPAIDASAAAQVIGTLDLDGNARVADNNGDASAVADYGCYESLFHAAVTPTFSVPVPGKLSAIRGQAISLEISIDAGASITGPVTASVIYPEGISGDTLLSFDDGSDTAILNFTVASDAPDGALRIMIAESSSAYGILPAIYDIYAADLNLTAGGERFSILQDDELDIHVGLATAGAVTPTAITVTAGTASGDGTSSISWIGDNIIAANASSTPGALHVIAGYGVNTIDLTLSSGTFLETDSTTITLTITAHDGVLRVDAVNGDDSIATGLEGGIPYRSVTKALANISVGAIIIAPGTYSPTATGEVFPLRPGSIFLHGASMDDTILDAEDSADYVIEYASGETGALSGLALRNSSNAALYIFDADCVFTNLAFTQATANNDLPGGFWARENSHVEGVGCVFTNMARRAAAYATQSSLSTSGNRRVNLIDCLFENNKSYYAAVSTFPSSWYAWNLTNCVFRTNTTRTNNDIHDSKSSSCIWVEIGDHGSKNRFNADRCQFLGNTGNEIIAGDHSILHFTSCLFAGNAPTVAMLRGYGFVPYFRNCTFVGNSKGYYAGDNSNFENCFYNSIFANEGPLTPAGGASKVRLSNCILHNTDVGGGYTEIDLGTVKAGMDPILENTAVAWDDAAFDARPRPYSPAIDASRADAILSAFDLDGRARIADNNDDGTAAADIGCYESAFHASASPMFYLPLPGKGSAFRGGPTTIPVSIDPPAESYPVTATVAYGEGLSGAETLVFADATTTNELVVAVAADAPANARISFADAADPAGVVPAAYDFVLGDMSLTIGGATTINVRSGDTIDIPVSIALEDTVAPQAISIQVDSPLGSGTSEIAWQGDGMIPVGAAASSGSLRITGGMGVNTVIITGDFPFDETDSTQVTLTIVAYDGALYADPVNGSDETGTGLADAPFQSITHTVSVLSKGDEVRALPGTYTEENGEIFPIEPYGVAIRGWDGEGYADPAAVVIDGTNGVLTLVNYGYGDGAYTGFVANVTLCESKEALLVADSCEVIVSNCVFTQSVASSPLFTQAAAGGIQAKDSCQLHVRDCVFDGIRRLAAVHGTSSNQQRNGGLIDIADTLFTNCVSSMGAVGASRACPVFRISRCAFVDNDTPAWETSGGNYDTRPGFVHDALAGSAIYFYGSGANTQNRIPEATIDRCVFLGNKGNVLVGVEYMDKDLILSNCLFADNAPRYGMFGGYSFVPSFANCTFVRNTGNYASRHTESKIRNSIFYRDGALVRRFEGAPHNEIGTASLANCIVFDTPDGESDRVSFADEPIREDPRLRKVGTAEEPILWDNPAFDASISPSSPAKDAANSAYVVGEFDLVGNPRVLFKGADIGCYECISSSGTLLFLR